MVQANVNADISSVPSDDPRSQTSVTFNPAQLRRFDLTLSDIEEAIRIADRATSGVARPVIRLRTAQSLALLCLMSGWPSSSRAMRSSVAASGPGLDVGRVPAAELANPDVAEADRVAVVLEVEGRGAWPFGDFAGRSVW